METSKRLNLYTGVVTNSFHFRTKFLELFQLECHVDGFILHEIGRITDLVEVLLQKRTQYTSMAINAILFTVSWNISSNLTRFSSTNKPLGAYNKGVMT